jgi:hypothetical protein
MLAHGSSPRGTCSSGANPGRAADPDPHKADLLDPDLGVCTLNFSVADPDP